MTMPGQVNIRLDTRQVERYFNNLDYALTTAESRSILRKASTRTIIRGLKANMTVKSSNLRKSFGNVTGKSTNPAIIFAGPRMDRDHNVRRSTPMGMITVTRAAQYKGHLANIIENNTFRLRYPRDPRRQLSKPRIPGFTRGKRPPYNIFEHTGIFRQGRPFIDKTYRIQAKPFLRETISQSQKLIEKVRA